MPGRGGRSRPPRPVVATGIHLEEKRQAEMMGTSATGNRVTFTGTQTDYISSGKMVESWSNWYTLDMLQQIGAAPAPGRQSGS